MKVKTRYNFVQSKFGELCKYYDRQNIVVLYIFKSGWSYPQMYQCIEEWGEYEESEYHLYTAEDINHIYAINTLLRKEKLNKINESTL